LAGHLLRKGVEMDLPTKCKGDFILYLFPAGWYRNCTSHSKIWYVGFD